MKKITHKSSITKDAYTNYVIENFDIQDSESTTVDIPVNFKECRFFDWNIGVIYGGSGTGKTSLLKHFGNLSKSKFDENKSLISNFDWLEPKEASFLLSAMGLSSVPTWLRPYQTLSNGEQYRAELAYKVGKSKEDDIILIDEFTSVVDRDVAKSMSNALQKYIRKHNKRIILASCHFDIMEWLKPDWTYSPLKGRVERHEYLRQSRPKIELSIFRCRYETWDIFKKHHYMSENLNKVSKCFLVEWSGKPVAFIAIIPSPSGYVKNAFRCSRIVVFPDYQGLGIGYSIVNCFAKMYNNIGCVFYIKTSHLPFVERFKNEDWIVKKSDQRKHKKGVGYDHWKRKTSECYTMRYKGEKDDDPTDLITFNAESFKDVAQNQISMF